MRSDASVDRCTGGLLKLRVERPDDAIEYSATLIGRGNASEEKADID